MKAAQSRGVKFGRKAKLTPAQIAHARQQLDQGTAVRDVAALLNIHRSTLYCVLRED